MSVLNASVFGVVAALVVGGADYAMTIKKHVGQDYGLIDHIEFRLGSVMPGSGVAKALPPAATGWDVRDASIEDSLRMTGQPVDAAKLASMTALNDKIIAAIPGLQTEDRVYQNGEAEVFLDISFVPANMKDSKASRAMAQVFSSVYDQAGQGADVGDGAHLFRKVIAPDAGKAVAYFAAPDGQIFISALSTASEEDTLALLADIDNGVLQLLVINDPTIGQKADVAAGEAPEKAAACVQKGAAKFCSADN